MARFPLVRMTKCRSTTLAYPPDFGSGPTFGSGIGDRPRSAAAACRLKHRHGQGSKCRSSGPRPGRAGCRSAVLDRPTRTRPGSRTARLPRSAGRPAKQLSAFPAPRKCPDVPTIPHPRVSETIHRIASVCKGLPQRCSRQGDVVVNTPYTTPLPTLASAGRAPERLRFRPDRRALMGASVLMRAAATPTTGRFAPFGGVGGDSRFSRKGSRPRLAIRAVPLAKADAV